METPKTHRLKDENIVGKMCRCQDCGVTQICSPIFDFYTLSFKKYQKDEPKPLYCESCLWIQLKLHEDLLKKNSEY